MILHTKAKQKSVVHYSVLYILQKTKLRLSEILVYNGGLISACDLLLVLS